MHDAARQPPAPKLDALIARAVEEAGIEEIRAAAQRSFPPARQPYWTQLLKNLFGSAVVASLLLGLASWATSYTAEKIQGSWAQEEKARANRVALFEHYRDAHRSRWNHGTLLASALTWGLPWELIMKRKADYDAAYLDTNLLAPQARDYLDREIVFEGWKPPKDWKESSVTEYVIWRGLVPITRLHDQLF